MSAGEFDSIGWAPGSVRGARSFKVDRLGRLTGLHYPQVWVPGDNQAECRKRDDDFSFNVTYTSLYRSLMGSPTYALWSDPTPQPTLISKPTLPPAHKKRGRKKVETVEVPRMPAGYTPGSIRFTPPEVPKPKPHTMTDCACGFYGYYDGSDDYYKPGMVSAVVDGFGETLIGTRGFRAMKARILALHIPEDMDRHRIQIMRNYPVPVFARFSDMVSEFPPDGGEAAPNVPADPDFWTREL